jgi:hypothetical protein
VTDLPTIITSAGLQPQLPADLNAQLIAEATTLAPGLTANLPASMVEDMASTATGALVLIDQARVDTVNSLTPYGANLFLLNLLAQIYLGQGSTAAPPSNTSVFVVFTGTVGFPIPKSFVVGDGGNQYTVQDGGIIPTGGSTQPLFCLATQPGSFAVPAHTVVNLITSVPGSITLSVTNPLDGTPGGPAQTSDDRRAQVLTAGLAASQGMPRALRTALQKVSGVQSRLISIRAQSGGGWEVIVGGNGDPYEIANAIFNSIFDVTTLTGSVIAITGITIGVDTTSSGTWTSGGVVTPNFRNVLVTIDNYPDNYTIPIVIPPVQTVTMTVTWNTSSANFVSPVGVAQLTQPALAAYINSIPVGAPINTFEMDAVFQAAIAPILSVVLLTRLVWSVNINGITTAPGSGTGAIAGDPESYFSATAAGITVIQG